MRYRLRTLLIATTLAALACLALRAPSFWGSGGLFAAFMLVFLASVLVAIFRSGQIRAMAIGFCVFSAGFLTVEAQVWPGGSSAVSLPTNQLLSWSFDKLYRDQKPQSQPTDDPFSPSYPDPLSKQLYAYKGICITALAFVVGLLGAALGQFLERTRAVRSSATPAES